MRRSVSLGILMLSASTVFGQIRITPLFQLDGQTSEPTLAPDGVNVLFEWTQSNYSVGLYTRALSSGAVRLIAGTNDRDGSPALARWSPDGHLIAFIRFYSHWDTHLVVRTLAANTERDLGNVCMYRPSWTPDSKFIIASEQSEPGDCRPTLYSVTTGQTVRELVRDGGSPTLSPDGKALAYADAKALKLLRLTKDYRPAGPASKLAVESHEISGIAWTPDSGTIVYQTWGDVRYLRRIKAQQRSRPETIAGLTANLSVAEFLPDGSALATETTQVEGLWRADLQSTPIKIERTTEEDCSGGGPHCSPDGHSRVFITTITGISQLWVANANGTNERPLVQSIPAFEQPDDGVPSLVGWSPDGKWIAFTVSPARGNADVRSYLYIVPSSGGTPRRLGKTADALYAPSWSRTSKSLYAAQGWDIENQTYSGDSTLVRVDVANGQISPIGAAGMSPQESPDGQFVYFFTTPYLKLSRIRLADQTVEVLWDRKNLDWFNWSISTTNLYLFQSMIQTSSESRTALVNFDPEKRRLTKLGEVPFEPQTAHLSRDERFLYFEQVEAPKCRVVLVRGLI